MLELVGWEFCYEGGKRLRGWRTKPRGLPVIFFLHGNGLCGMSYWPLLQRLCDEYDIVMLDAPGHGNSDASGSFLGWEKTAEVCFSAWISLASDYDQVTKHAVGHSFGGVLCLSMMADCPDCFDSAVLLDPVLFPPAMLLLGRGLQMLGLLKYHRLARTTSRRRDQWPSIEAAREYLLARRVYAKWESACFELYLEHGLEDFDGGVQLRCSKKLETSIYASMPFKLPNMVKRVRTPCVIVSGDVSYEYVTKSVPRYCFGHPFIEHKEISGGHNFMLEKTSQSSDWIRQAFAKITP